jgi:hypothetical protein
LPAHRWVASNLSLRPAQPTRQLSGGLPGPRQPPSGAGHQALSTGLGLPLAFRRVAFASWAVLCPLRAWAVLPKIVRLTGLVGQTASGLPRSAPVETRRGWVPPITARPGCPSVPGVACLDQTEGAVWCLAESSSRQPSVATTFRYAASTEVHWHSPVPPFPHPVGLDGSGSPWASPACSRTPRYRGACAGWEPTWAQVGAVVTRHGPLIWCDFVSHTLHVILATFRRQSSAGIRAPDRTLPAIGPAGRPAAAG